MVDKLIAFPEINPCSAAVEQSPRKRMVVGPIPTSGCTVTTTPFLRPNHCGGSKASDPCIMGNPAARWCVLAAGNRVNAVPCPASLQTAHQTRRPRPSGCSDYHRHQPSAISHQPPPTTAPHRRHHRHDPAHQRRSRRAGQCIAVGGKSIEHDPAAAPPGPHVELATIASQTTGRPTIA